MASSNRGLLIGCVAVTLLGGGCVMTGVVGAGAWFFLARAESVPPIAFEGFDPQGSPPVGYPPTGYPPPSAPIPSIVPVPTPPVPTDPIGIAPPPEVAPPEPAGVMRLTSVPDGARVSEGGVALGVTPLDVPVAPRGGSRTLSVEADGYLGSDVTIYDTPGTQRVTLQQARVAEPTPSRDSTATAGSGSRTGSSGSGSSGSGSSGSASSGSGSSGSGSRTGSTSTTGERPVAATIRPGTGSGTTPRTGTTGSTTGTTGTSRPPRTGALSHDDF